VSPCVGDSAGGVRCGIIVRIPYRDVETTTDPRCVTMRLTHLSLTNFRNYSRLELDLPEGVTLLQGDNAQGKTNLLESIYYLATSRSPQTSAEMELVNWLVRDDIAVFTRLVADILWDGRTQRVELVLAPAANGRANGLTFRKQIRINGVPKRAMDLIGLVNVVIFRPQDIDLVSGSPSLRRRYLDAMLCQLDNQYCRTLALYNRVLNQRNCLLRTLRERTCDPAQLEFWDDRLVEHGCYVTARRYDGLFALSRIALELHQDMTEQREPLALLYRPSISCSDSAPPDGEAVLSPLTDEWHLGRTPASSMVSAFREALRGSRKEEIARGLTLVGPHRDDFRFLSAAVDLSIYGSRGQQRTAALTLKLAETEVVRRVKGYWPVLLLDDVMSELDGQRRLRLMELVTGATQTVITTTDVDAYSIQFLSKVARYRVREGRLEQLED